MDYPDVSFSVRDAQESADEAARRTFHSYSKFANACRVRLSRFVRENPKQLFMIYAVPLVIVGGALYSARDAINHVIHALKGDGFQVAYLGENLIYISWKCKEAVRYRVSDYVTSASTGRMPAPEAPRQQHGPGPAVPAVAATAPHGYRRHLDSQIAARSRAYQESDDTVAARLVFNNSTTHEQAMRRATASRRHEML